MSQTIFEISEHYNDLVLLMSLNENGAASTLLLCFYVTSSAENRKLHFLISLALHFLPNAMPSSKKH